MEPFGPVTISVTGFQERHQDDRLSRKTGRFVSHPQTVNDELPAAVP
jgi:hypothetical protein